MNEKRRVLLVIRDGYGYKNPATDNAITLAKKPFTDSLSKNPKCLLKTDGEAVGLPPGYMGGSEVGHLTIGSGRILYQNFERINNEIATGAFAKRPAIVELIKKAKAGSQIHLIGLLQDAGVHAHQNHLFEILEICAKAGVANKVHVHVTSDGRDTPPHSLDTYAQTLIEHCKKTGVRISSLCGRFYAMDRDKRWERTELAYDLYMNAEGKQHETLLAAIADARTANETDEFIKPRVIGDFKGVAKDDCFFFWNYRSDRMRQINQALLDTTFTQFSRKDITYTVFGMMQYYDGFNGIACYEQQSVSRLLADVIADANLTQLRISETEKYPHVTFFFNGQQDTPKNGEERIMISSPKEVKTYDQKPQMSAPELATKVCEQIALKKFDFIVLNIVNADMVGHCGDLGATIKAVEAVDAALAQVVPSALQNKYTILLTADHGNAEEMTGEHQTSHTLNKVECLLISPDAQLQKKTLHDGGLADLAPTIIDLLGLQKPIEMTGTSLISK